MPLPQKRLIPGILIALMIAAIAAPPLWWTEGTSPVIPPGAIENNKGPANIGQAKHMVKSALDALRPILPNATTQIEADLAPIIDLTVPDPKPADWADKQKAPLLIGQLKAIAKPFYDHLRAHDAVWLDNAMAACSLVVTEPGSNPPTNSPYPWTVAADDDANRAPANVGQLKAVFSLPLETLAPPFIDEDEDGMDDNWELANGLDPTDGEDASEDSDGDGLSNGEEYDEGSDPNLEDTDGDELNDGEDAVPTDAEINWSKTPENQYVWIEQVTKTGARSVSRHGHILFPTSNGGSSNLYDLQVLWDSATSSWVNLTGENSWSDSGFWNGQDWPLGTSIFNPGWIHIDNMNDDGIIVGRSESIGNANIAIIGASAIMRWQRNGTASNDYADPIYIVPGFEYVDPLYDLEKQLVGNAPKIADDGTISAIAYETSPPDESGANSFHDIWVTSPPQLANHFKEMSTWASFDSDPDWNTTYEAGLSLDSNGGLLVERDRRNPETILHYRYGDIFESLEGIIPNYAQAITPTDIGRTPETYESSGGRIWFSLYHNEGLITFLEKRDGGSGVSRWHNPPSMSEGAVHLNTKGEAIVTTGSTPKIWRNGKYTDLNEVASKPETVTITNAIDLASNGIILATANDDGVSKTGLLLPLDMTISHPELDGDDAPDYVVNADVAATLITVGLSPARDGSIIEWEIEEGDGTLSVTESTTVDGFASTTLTTSTNAGDTYRVKARIKKLVITSADENTQAFEFDFSASAYANVTGIEQTTDVITVIPGYAASITVEREPAEQGGSTTELPADGVSEMTFVATVNDQFGQPVAVNTPVVWHLGGLGFIEPETPSTDYSGIARAKVVAGHAEGLQTVRIEADGFEVSETLENSAISGSLMAGATTLDLATNETTTLTASFPYVFDGATIRWYASRGEIINAASTVEGGQATATLRAGGGRIGNALVTASVGGTTHAAEINFVSSSPISVEVDHPVIVGDATTAGAASVPQIDGTSQSVAYHTSTPVKIKAPAYAGQTANVQFGDMVSDIVARFHMDEINGTITQDEVGAHDATILGAILDAAHRHEGDASLYYDGVTSSLNIADHADLRIQDTLTVSAWVHAAASAGTIIAKPGEYRIFIDGQGRGVFGVTTTAGEQLVVGPALPLNRWCQISANYEESGVITISVDGMKATSQTGGILTPGTNAITIGESFEGWIDLLEISLGKQFISGTGLDVTGLSGGQVVLDGNGEAVVNLSSGAQSVVSAATPVQSVAIRVSINPEVKLEDVVVVASKEAYTVLDAAMSDMKVTTASQSSNLSAASRQDVVARNLLEFASTGQRSSALPFVPAGNITDRLRYAHRAALWLGETVDAAHDVRDILENSHPLDLPSERKYHLSDQVQILLTESIQGGSDSGANQYLDDAYGGLVGTLTGLSGQANFKHLTTLVDGGAAFEEMAIAHENHGAELIEDIAILAECQAAEPTFCQRILGSLRGFDDVINGQLQQVIFTTTEDFIQKHCEQAITDDKLTEDEVFAIGFGWGLAAEAQVLSQLTNQRAAKRLAEQMVTTIIAAIRGDENARKGLMEAIPLWGLKVMNDEANNLIDQEKHFDAGMKSAQLTVAAVGTVTAVGGMVKGGVSMARAAKNVAKPIKGRPPRLPVSLGLSKSLNPSHATLVTEFKNANPFLKLPGAPKINLHHAVPRTILKRRKHLLAEGEIISEREMHSLANARGIPHDLRLPNGSRLHQHITNVWETWFDIKQANSLRVTRQQLLDFAGLIDSKYGHLFIPPIR